MITAPTVEYGMVSPMLIVFGAAVAGVMVEVFAPPAHRLTVHLGLSAAALLSALAAVFALAGTRSSAVMGAVAVDGPALFVQGLILLIAILSLPVIAGRRAAAFTPHAAAVPGSAAEVEAVRAGAVQTAVFPLTMFAVGGMLLFPAADDLLTMFIALEVMSLPLYVMCGLARRRRVLSQEAALKYFLLGAFSSAFFLYGIALLYGHTGSLSLAGIGTGIASEPGGNTLLVGLGLLLIGIMFKVGAVPFHSWVPDVYQGAPTPVTGFMAAATKIAAFGAMLRILCVALPELRADWRPVLSVVAAVTMIGGAVLAVTQTDVKRMLAYSAVAQAGFVMLGPVAGSDAGVSSTLFYLAVYGVGVVGAFAIIGLVRNTDDHEDTDIDRWAGLGRRSPALALAFTVFLLAFAGIPLTSGFIGKFAVFHAAAASGAVTLVVIGVIASVVAGFVYVRMIRLMFFAAVPADAGPLPVPGRWASAAIMVAVIVTVVAGVLPQPLLDLAGGVGGFVG